MDRQAVWRLLMDVAAGRVTVAAASARLRRLPYEDVGFAKIDVHRALRGGAPEAVFCPGKTPSQVVEIVRRLSADHCNVLATRAEAPVAAAVAAAALPHVYHAVARVVVVRPEPVGGVGLIVVVAAGTADVAVADEAALVAETLGNRVERVYDCGVTGLHRLVDRLPVLAEASVIIAVAGMEGALRSVIGGLVDRPVIAVPTSIGCGASFGGVVALLAMLNSCAPGVSVVTVTLTTDTVRRIRRARLTISSPRCTEVVSRLMWKSERRSSGIGTLTEPRPRGYHDMAAAAIVVPGGAERLRFRSGLVVSTVTRLDAVTPPTAAAC